ncbi:MAG: AAA family ATPase, partial [Thermovirgaceae bacterium]
MSIGRIHLKGFKSFGGSHEIALCENFTAVVGPNGCGKSNILDALRWVLGDGNPSRLRILKQGDLLFQGSISLPPATSSEVMIHLKGEEKVSTLRRRFTNEEGGTLLFEGRRIRLVDLDEIKRQWRLEGDRFAFISQGEVSEVIQQKPLQRRMHLESLFGIDLYRKQREEAVQKLDAATLELQRIMTLQSELRTRKEVIADPVLRAREAKAVIDDLEREKSRLYWVKRARSERVLESIGVELSVLGAQARAASFWVSGWG